MNECNRISMIYSDHWGFLVNFMIDSGNFMLDSGVVRIVNVKLLDQVKSQLVAIDLILYELEL
jgi:hypothetical protein